MYREMIVSNVSLAGMILKHRQKRIEQHGDLLAAIVECSEDAIIAEDTNKTIIAWNKKAEKLLEYTASEIIGKPTSFIIQATTKKTQTSVSDLQAITKSGREMTIKFLITPLRNKTGETIGTAFRSQNIYEEEQAEKDKDTFVNIASHELKTPITSIKAYAQILERKFKEEGDIKSVEYMTKMHTQINRLTYLVRDLVDINKIQTETIQINSELFDLDVLIDEIIGEVTPLAPYMKFTKVGSLTQQIKADRVQIGQVIINLLSNAIKFSSSSATLIIHTTRTDKEVVVGIQDFGQGIEREHQKRIFEKFYRVSRERNAEFPGLGVGLYISSEIIKSHKGKIWFESNQKEGSIFYFSLPV